MPSVTIIRDEHDFASLDIRVNGVPVQAVDSISLSDDVEVSVIRGTGGRPVGIVRGKYSARGSVTLAKSREIEFLRDCGVQESVFGHSPMTWNVAASTAEGATERILKGVVFNGRRESHSQRSGVLVVTYDLIIQSISTNGFPGI